MIKHTYAVHSLSILPPNDFLDLYNVELMVIAIIASLLNPEHRHSKRTVYWKISKSKLDQFQ